MIDIHAHILPDLDDGPKSLEDSLNLIEMSAESGVTGIIATSHGNYYDYTLDKYWEKFILVKEHIQKYRIPLRIYSGMEIFVNGKTLELLKEKKLLSLNGGHYILIEFEFNENQNIVFERIKEFQKEGLKVILAHPERYIFVQEKPEILEDLIENDCAMQINYRSLKGDFGEQEYRIAVAMLRSGMVHFIASDGHTSSWRDTSFAGMIPLLKKMISPGYIKLLVDTNPTLVLRDEEIFTMPLKRIEL